MEIAKLVLEYNRVLVWPLLALIVTLLFRSELADLLNRIRHASLAGFSIACAEAIEQVKKEVTKVNVERLKELQVGSEIEAQSGMSRGKKDLQEAETVLEELAKEYLAVKEPSWRDPDWKEKVEFMNRLVNRMTNAVLMSNISRQVLADSQNPGWMVALAGTVLSLPQAGDAERLLQVAQKLKKLHGRYWVVLAMANLFAQGLVVNNVKNGCLAMLDLFEVDADPPLLGRIALTRSLIL